MGAKLLAANETTNAHDSREKEVIFLQNWRAIREWKHKDLFGLYIIIKSFRLYFIPDFTMSDLHEANHNNVKLDIPYVYVKNVLSCPQCFGDGKQDWIETARGGKTDKERTYHRGPDKFARSRVGPINIVDFDVHTAPYYTSTVHLRKGDEICKKCSGSGLLLAERDLIKDSIVIKES